MPKRGEAVDELPGVAGDASFRAGGRTAPYARDPTMDWSMASHWQWYWMSVPRTALLITKLGDENTVAPAQDIADALGAQGLTVLVEPDAVPNYTPGSVSSWMDHTPAQHLARVTDFVVVLGGDGTLLHLSTMFPRHAPPVLSFSMGTMSFLMPYHVQEWREALVRTLRGGFSLVGRARLHAEVYTPSRTTPTPPPPTPPGSLPPRAPREVAAMSSGNIVNDVVIHRGAAPTPAKLACFINEEFFTNIVGDGLCISTPTGSTAYNLSAGGPMIHPAVRCIAVTPISPLSLSFRPALFPQNTKLRIRLSPAARSPVMVSFDGRPKTIDMQAGDSVSISLSEYPIPTITRNGVNKDWISDINHLLTFHTKVMVAAPTESQTYEKRPIGLEVPPRE